MLSKEEIGNMSEKAKGVGNGIFGIILGAMETIFAAFLVTFALNFATMVTADFPAANYVNATYIPGLYNAAGAMILIGGLYVLIDGIKRIVDQGFATVITSKQQKTSAKLPTLNPPQVMATNVSMPTDNIDKLQKLKGMLDRELISQQEYDAQKKKIISEM